MQSPKCKIGICNLSVELSEPQGWIRRFSVPLTLLVLLTCPGVGGVRGELTVVDDRGTKLTFPRTPERVVSLVPSVTEVIFALGAEGKLVGVTTFCDYPPEAKLKPKVGDFSNPSLERISVLEPEVVFATTPEQKATIDALENLGIRVFCIQPESVKETLGAIQKAGTILSARSAADSLARELTHRLDYISRLVRSTERRTVYIEIATDPLMTATENSFVGELITAAGGKNLAKGPKPYIAMNPERVVGQDPEVIIIAHPISQPDDVKERLGWETISAIRNNRVYRVNADLVLRPGPRMVEGILEILEKIHPEIDISPSERAPQRRKE